VSRRGSVKPDGTESNRPLLIGVLAAVVLPLMAFGSLLFFQARNADLEKQDADLNNKLGNLETQRKRVAAINTEIGQINNQTQALASVFNQIKPWSAMMQDIRDRIPPTIQLIEVKQLAADATRGQPTPNSASRGLDLSKPTPSASAQPSPSPSPSPGASPAVPQTNIVEISGTASNFSDVNDFLLVLQKSNFLNPAETRLIKAELGKEEKLKDIRLKNSPQDTTPEDLKPMLPARVSFTIQTALNTVPASDVLRELDRKGAAGLVTRIEALQQKGVIRQ